jgi:hypothetical protein
MPVSACRRTGREPIYTVSALCWQRQRQSDLVIVVGALTYNNSSNEQMPDSNYGSSMGFLIVAGFLARVWSKI